MITKSDIRIGAFFTVLLMIVSAVIGIYLANTYEFSWKLSWYRSRDACNWRTCQVQNEPKYEAAHFMACLGLRR